MPAPRPHAIVGRTSPQPRKAPHARDPPPHPAAAAAGRPGDPGLHQPDRLARRHGRRLDRRHLHLRRRVPPHPAPDPGRGPRARRAAGHHRLGRQGHGPGALPRPHLARGEPHERAPGLHCRDHHRRPRRIDQPRRPAPLLDPDAPDPAARHHRPRGHRDHGRAGGRPRLPQQRRVLRHRRPRRGLDHGDGRPRPRRPGRPLGRHPRARRHDQRLRQRRPHRRRSPTTAARPACTRT